MPVSAASFALQDAYTREVLAWRMGGSAAPSPSSTPKEPQANTIRWAQRLARMHTASGRKVCLLLGVGDGHVPALLVRYLPPATPLIILECHMDAARGVLPWLSQEPGYHLLADTSPWALFMLTRGLGLTPEHVTLAHIPATVSSFTNTPAPPSPLKTWHKLFAGSQHEALPPEPRWDGAFRLSVGCILHPEEPRLAEFFAQIPAWVHDVAVIWDGAPPPEMPICSVPVRSGVRALDGDFAAQRNAMLAQCTGSWCLYLDADERLSPQTWQALPRLAALPHVGGVLFPRYTFEGDTQHVRVGYGLWPDVQLRLFSLKPGLRFAGTVHERVLGLDGSIRLAAGMPLLHYSHVFKDRTTLEARLAVFDHAVDSGGRADTGGTTRHILSSAYPSLPLADMMRAGEQYGHAHVLRLPLPAAR